MKREHPENAPRDSRTDRFAQATIDALTAHICVVDEKGTILAVNEAWRRFGKENPPVPGHCFLGTNYLSVCDLAGGATSAEAAPFAAGLRNVLAGRLAKFTLEYPCYAPGKPRWFVARVTRFAGNDPVRAVVAHENITERKRAQEKLRRSQEGLRKLAAHVERVREEERARIARTIHDDLGHAITDLRLDLGWLSRRLAEAGFTGRTSIRRRIAVMSRRAEASAETVRGIATELRPAVLDALGLTAAIEWQIRKFQQRTRIRCELNTAGDLPRLDAAQSTAMFRVFQEILNNIVQHAQASRVRVQLTVIQGLLVLRVGDNGRGITEAEVSSPAALGLLGMRERAGALGGGVTIARAPGRGTLVTVSIPINPS